MTKCRSRCKARKRRSASIQAWRANRIVERIVRYMAAHDRRVLAIEQPTKRTAKFIWKDRTGTFGISTIVGFHNLAYQESIWRPDGVRLESGEIWQYPSHDHLLAGKEDPHGVHA